MSALRIGRIIYPRFASHQANVTLYREFYSFPTLFSKSRKGRPGPPPKKATVLETPPALNRPRMDKELLQTMNGLSPVSKVRLVREQPNDVTSEHSSSDQEGRKKNTVKLMSINAALELAAETKLQLVEVDASQSPPICRLIDVAQKEKEKKLREKEAKKARGKTNIIRMNLRTEGHALDMKTNQIREFILKGRNVRLQFNFFRPKDRTAEAYATATQEMEKIYETIRDVAKFHPPTKLPEAAITLDCQFTPLSRKQAASASTSESTQATSSPTSSPDSENKEA
eukprot:Rmarinus@m.29349